MILEQFRSFREEQRASLRPLTLVYGPNSSGKSSLVRSLLLLKQSISSGSTHSLSVKGPLVDLGSVKTLAHAHEGTPKIGVRFESEIRDKQVTTEIVFHLSTIGNEHECVTLRFLDLEHGEVELRFNRYGDDLKQMMLVDQSANQFEHLELLMMGTRAEPLFESPSASRPIFANNSLIPGRVESRFGSGRLRSNQLSELTKAEAFWNELCDSIVESFRKSLDGISYLGPLRRPWERLEEVDQHATINGVGSDGDNSLALLHKHKDILGRVNRDLKEALESEYELKIVFLAEELRQRGIISVVPPLIVPVLEHRDSLIHISPVDAGFGLSQLLPIVIEMNVRRDSLICIEQPELHLHPRLQARVGQLLRDAIMGANGNRFLIETHSEHLLLRIKRLIREGQLQSSDVQILYVNNQHFDKESQSFLAMSESQILEISLGDDGELLDPWPGGFFDERFEEMPSWSDFKKEMSSPVPRAQDSKA